jgi:hypothetical protein
MKSYTNNRGEAPIHVLFTMALVAFIFCAGFTIDFILGVDGFGPTNVTETKVVRLYVDRGSHSSHYMIGTEAGVFEVQNRLILGIYNADEIYSKIQEGKTYRITAKGNKVVNWFFQEYPLVLSAEPIGGAK